MKTATYLGDNVIGFKLLNIAEVIKAQTSGLTICDKYIEMYDYNVFYTNEEGLECEREATDEEVLERITDALRCNKEVYACVLLDEEYKICLNRSTTLQSNFSVGMKVYTMDNNKIVEATIDYLSLSQGKLSQLTADSYLGRIAERLYHMTHEYSSLEPCVKQKMVEEMQSLATNDFVVLKIKDKHLTRKLTEIFSTKEELVKHLMEQ